MLLFKHRVKPSPIHGLGVFTSERIREGDLVWRFDPAIDQEIRLEELLAMPHHTVLQVLEHSEYHSERGVFVLAADGDYYMNHADKPSLVDEDRLMFAAHDIEVGEELTCDYRVVRVVAFHPDERKSPFPATKLMQGLFAERCPHYLAKAIDSLRSDI